MMINKQNNIFSAIIGIIITSAIVAELYVGILHIYPYIIKWINTVFYATNFYSSKIIICWIFLLLAVSFIIGVGLSVLIMIDIIIHFTKEVFKK